MTTRPTARVLALLEILQGGGTHTVGALADRLGVDERTVRRYAEHLLDLDVPVESVRGRYGGYRLAPGFRMPPLMLTDEEALAVLLGLVEGRRAGLVTASPEAADTAAAKVRRVLPKPLAARLDALFAGTAFTATARDRPTPTAPVMLELAEATRQHRPISFSYTDRTGRHSDRTVHPYGLVVHSGRWYVTGADTTSGELRTFRLDRITHPRTATGSFTVPEGFRPADAVRTSLAAAPWRHRVTVLVQGTTDEVRSRLPPGIANLATITPAAHPGWSTLHLRAERLDWLPGLLAGLALPFVIEEPTELRATMQTWMTRAATCAAATSPEEAASAWRNAPTGAELDAPPRADAPHATEHLDE